MTSCESSRTSAYSQDIRWRIIYQYYGLQLSHHNIATNLNIDKSTVCRIIALLESTGDVTKAVYPHGQNHHRHKLTEIDQYLIMEIVVDQPGIYLREIQQYLLEETGTSVSLPTLCNFLCKQGFSRQKMVRVSVGRSLESRTKFWEEVSIFNTEMFVFIDESGSDRRDCLRKFGYSLRGEPARALQFYNRGKHITALAAMSTEGVLECTLLEGGVCADNFQTFLEEKLCTILYPFNGINPHSIIILDNAAIHHASGVIDLLENLGVLIYFLPAYSPDMNPIEQLFAKVKLCLKTYELEHPHEDLETLLLMAFTEVTSSECQGWIGHAGY